MDDARAKPDKGEGSRFLAHYERGWSLLYRKDLCAARKAAAEMESLRPGNFYAAHLHGEIAHAACDYVESLRWYEKAIAQRPGYFDLYCRAADIALYAVRNAERALYHCRKGLECPDVPTMRVLVLVVMEAGSLVALGRRDEAAARLTTLDDHRAIQATLRPPADGHLAALAELEAEETDIYPEPEDVLRDFLTAVVSIGHLWLTLGSDRGAPLVRSACTLYPEFRANVERWFRHFKLDETRRVAYGLPPRLRASAPTSAGALSRCEGLVPVAENHPSGSLPASASGNSDDMGLLENLQSDLRRAQADQEGSLLVQVLRRRINELTFGDLRQILNNRIGEGLLARRVSDLFTVEDPARPEDATVRSTKPTSRPRSSATPPKKAAEGKSRRATAPKSQPPPKPPIVSAVTVAGRKKYDSAVLQFLRERGGWHPSGFVRAHVGGSKVQIRGAMVRLEEAALVERKGSFASSRYQARPV